MFKETATHEKSIVFIGFMGVGKTTVAKVIAKKLHRQFIDIDEEIEKEFDMPTTAIFKEIGEEKFREKEKEYILHYCNAPDKIVSLGGGAFLQEEIREACLKQATVIYLDISWDAWKSRLPLLIDSRPVLQNKSLEEIEALFNLRKETYAKHHVKIITDKYDQATIADQIIAILKLT